MHRSGTSAATGALRLAGVSLGNQLLEPGVDNPKGYWENTRAVAIHEQLLKALDRSWDDVRALPDGWTQGAAAAEAGAQIHALIDEQFADESLWAIKDPRLCRFVPLWKEVLEKRGIRAVALFVARHPDEVARSIETRNGWPMPVGKLLWMRYTFEAEEATRDLPRAVLTYDRLLKKPIDALLAAMTRLDVEVPPRDHVSLEELDSFLDAGDRHHSFNTEHIRATPVDEVLAQAYQQLVNIEAGAGDWRALGDSGAHAWSLLVPAIPEIDGVAAVAREWQKRCEIALAEGAEHHSKLIAQIRWSEEAVQRHDALHVDLAAAREQAQLQAFVANQVSNQAQLLGELSLSWTEQARRIAELHEWSADFHQWRRQEIEDLRAQLLELQRTNAVLEKRATDLQVVTDRSVAEAAMLRDEAHSLRVENQNLREDAHRLLGENHALMDERQQAVLQLNLVLRSFTWRFTRPLRSAVDWLRRLIS
ncbi:MAG TPA: hypothetical protein VD865_12410 [Stenotrophomonas sp.]|nr:hypothetical protein [Stenotrophomonas sp.]